MRSNLRRNIRLGAGHRTDISPLLAQLLLLRGGTIRLSIHPARRLGTAICITEHLLTYHAVGCSCPSSSVAGLGRQIAASIGQAPDSVSA